MKRLLCSFRSPSPERVQSVPFGRPCGTDMKDPRHDTRADYRHFLAIPTRWMDNDTYGHVNNVTYYSYFDTVGERATDPRRRARHPRRPVIGFVVETSCRFHRSLSFPETIDAGIRVTRLGRSSVTYEIALFSRDAAAPAATGRFVHVWVDRATETPADIPASIRAALLPLVRRGRFAMTGVAVCCEQMTAATAPTRRRCWLRSSATTSTTAPRRPPTATAAYRRFGARSNSSLPARNSASSGSPMRRGPERASMRLAPAWSAAPSRRRAARWSPSSTT